MNTAEVQNPEMPLQAEAAAHTDKVFKYKGSSVYDTQTSPNCFNLFTPGKDTIQAGGTWYSCRESFSPCFTPKTPGILFSVANVTEQKQVIAFIGEIETRLNLAERTTFIPTDNARILVVQLSPWWRTNLAKRQLLTILLRCGRVYTGKNFDAAVSSQNYLASTLVAFNHFMAGNYFVKPGGNERIKKAGGWFNYFRNIPADSERLRWLVNE